MLVLVGGGQNLDNIEHSRKPTIFKVFKVMVPGRRLGLKFENFENGGPIMLPSFRVPTPAPRGCGRAPIVNSVPAGGARLRGGGGVVAPTGRPEAIHFTEHFMTCLWLEEFQSVQRCGATGKGAATLLPSHRWLP